MNILAQRSGLNLHRMNTLHKTGGGRGRGTDLAPMRRIRRRRKIQIHIDSRQIRHITLAVRRIGLRTSTGILLPLRRLRKLPNLGIRSPASTQSRRPQSTAVRRRTSILINPQDDLLVHPSPNILRSSNSRPRPILNRLTAAIHPRPVAAIRNRLHPAPHVPKLTIGKPTTLLLVKKDDSAGREVLALSSRSRNRPIRLPQRQSSRVGGTPSSRDLRILTAIRKHEKAKIVLHQDLPLAAPVITRLARRVRQPVPNKREVLPQRRQSSITRIHIPVKTKMLNIRGTRTLPNGNNA